MRPEHPAAALFPVLEGAELQELADDIREHGLLEPIELLDGAVLDGRSRLAACELAGVEPDFTEANIDDLGPTVYVVSKNLKRRHLTVGQRAAIGAKMEPLLKAEAKERQRAAGREHGRGIASAPKTPTYPDAGKWATKAGEAVGVSRASVLRAHLLGKEAPELLEKVKAGTATLGQARRATGHIKPSGLAPMGSQKRSTIPVREHLRRVAHALNGYVIALESLALGKEDCEEELQAIVTEAKALVRAANGLRVRGGS